MTRASALGSAVEQMGLSENRVNLPNEIAIFHRDNDQQNHWVYNYPLAIGYFHWLL